MYSKSWMAFYNMTARIYTVNFYTYDAKFLTSKTAKYKEVITYTGPYVAGFSFIGWGPAPASVNQNLSYPGSNVTVYASANLYAKYTPV